MEWIVIEDFVPNVEEHIRLFNSLISKQTAIFVRKEYLEFEELAEAEKGEIIEENYVLFKDGLLGFPNNTSKESLESKIYEVVRKIPDFSINNKNFDMASVLRRVEEKRYIEHLKRIKEIITKEITEEHTKMESVLQKQNYAFRTEVNESYKYYESKGMLESERQYFDWYRAESMEMVKKFIDDNLFEYNIILTEDDTCKYYLNYYEGEKYLLAVRDNQGNFSKIFSEVFEDKYLIEKLTINR